MVYGVHRWPRGCSRDWSRIRQIHPDTHPVHTQALRHRGAKMAEPEASELTSAGIFQEIFTSPLNLTLLSLCLFLLYKIFRGDTPPDVGEVEPPLPKLKKRDFTLAELKPYDGLQDPRILMAVNGKVFDVTRGKKFYGPGEMLAAVAGLPTQRRARARGGFFFFA